MKKEKNLMNKKKIRNSKGVTLVEVLVALGLFAIIVAPLMRSFVTSVKVNKKSRDTMIATDVANTIMEGIRGKTYEEVVKALISSPSGFNSSVGDINSSSRLAFSSMDGNWYNLGHVGPSPAQGDATKKLLNSSDPASDGDYTGSYATTYTASDDCFPISCENLDDQEMCWEAIKEVSDLFTAYVDKDQSLYDANPYDKLLYFGFSSDMYPAPDAVSKGIPKLAYMFYSRIERENRYFDATVTFVPRSQYPGTLARNKTGETCHKYFSYEVTVKVYEYHYDAMSHRWIGRFDPDTGRLEGAPAAKVTSGILNKSINK